jgi:hypothetical protein
MGKSMKGETLIKRLREEYGVGPVTKYNAKSIYPANSKYIDAVFKKATEVGILKPTKKCRTAYVIDPDPTGKLVCSLQPNKPYEESICPIVEELIECAVKNGEGSICDRTLKAIQEIYTSNPGNS